MLVSLNARIVSEEEAKIPATDPAALYGLGVFEVLRAYRGRPFRLSDHLARMGRSARRFGLNRRSIPPSIEEQIRELCRRNLLEDAYVRLTLTGGGNFTIVTRPLESLPRSGYRLGARVLLCESRRDPRGILYGHKTLNYLENVLLRDRARKTGAADTVLLGLRGEVLEGCVSNVFLVRGGRLVTPSLDERILPGVTRKVVLELARERDIRVQERLVKAGELATADEVFLTNSLIEVLPITRVGRKRISGVGPITRVLAEAYRSRVSTDLH